jgi:hypothetical protein
MSHGNFAMCLVGALCITCVMGWFWLRAEMRHREVDSQRKRIDRLVGRG